MSNEKFLGTGYEKFLGMSNEKFLGTGYEKFLEMGYEKFLGLGYKNFLRIGSYLFPGKIHKKIARPGQKRVTARSSSQEFHNSNLSLEILEKISNFCRHFYRIFPLKIPGNFCGCSATLLPGMVQGVPRNMTVGRRLKGSDRQSEVVELSMQYCGQIL